MALVSLLVDEYEIALEFYVGKLGFHVREDTRLSPDKRWVVICPTPEAETGLLLARAVGEDQKAAIGNQAGDRVFLFLETDNFERDFMLYSACGVPLTEPPREEVYGKVAGFKDLYGNRWDLIETA